MSSIFTRMLAGEEPGRFVWRDAECAAVVADHPVRPGHVIVFPVAEVDHWTDLPPDVAARLFALMQQVGRAQRELFPCEKVGVAFIGLVTRHAHAHLVPISSMEEFDFTRQDPSPDPAALDAAAQALRAALA